MWTSKTYRVGKRQNSYELNHRVAICGMRPPVKEVLSSVRIDALLDVYDNLSELPFASDIHTSRES